MRKVQTTAGAVPLPELCLYQERPAQPHHLPDGSVLDYGRNPQGQIAEVASPCRPGTAGAAEPDPPPRLRPVAGWNYGNGRRMDRTLDQDYRPLTIEDATSGGLSLGSASTRWANS